MESTILRKIWKTYSYIPDIGCTNPINTIILGFDTDEAGSGATEKAIELIENTKNTCNCYYLHILKLMVKYGYLNLDQADFDQMKKWDKEELEIIDRTQKDRFKDLSEIRKQLYQWIAEEGDFYVECRSRFLKQKIESCEQYINRFYAQYAKNRERRLSYQAREILKLFWDKEGVEVQLMKAQKELYRLEHRKELKEGQITEEMIVRAKEYPFERLLEFSQSGFTTCPYHTEKTASFSLNRKLNYAHCFGCNKTVDTIQYVIDSTKKSFKDTVLFLNG